MLYVSTRKDSNVKRILARLTFEETLFHVRPPPDGHLTATECILHICTVTDTRAHVWTTSVLNPTLPQSHSSQLPWERSHTCNLCVSLGTPMHNITNSRTRILHANTSLMKYSTNLADEIAVIYIYLYLRTCSLQDCLRNASFINVVGILSQLASTQAPPGYPVLYVSTRKDSNGESILARLTFEETLFHVRPPPDGHLTATECILHICTVTDTRAHVWTTSVLNPTLPQSHSSQLPWERSHTCNLCVSLGTPMHSIANSRTRILHTNTKYSTNVADEIG